MTSPNPQEGGKHTPAPWRLVADEDHIGTHVEPVYSVHGTMASGVEFCGIARMSRGDPMLEANARLIAAAPALLEALDLAVAILQEAEPRLGYADGSLGQIEIEDAIETGLAALLQATGGENGR